MPKTYHPSGQSAQPQPPAPAEEVAIAPTGPPRRASAAEEAIIPPQPQRQPRPLLRRTPAICARRIFHQADPTIFKEDCKRNPCQFRHNVRLHNGKLGAGDKESLRASLEAMNGKFADLALQHIDALL
jgi:hypothetical protein